MIRVNQRKRNIHFVGIGGAGMSGLALILHNLGYTVTGSDRAASAVTRDLTRQGIRVFRRHEASNIQGADLLVFSSAVPRDNPELAAAREARIPVMRRAEMLGEIMRMKFSVAVSGTHGKTTTTSMIGSILNAARLSPTLIVGGIVRKLNTNAQLGKDVYAVIEADEYDRSFLVMYPSMAVVTTLEADHLDCYKDLDEIKNAFVEFCNKVPFYGCNVLCIDEPNIQEILPRIAKNVVTYGLLPQAHYTAREIAYEGMGSHFSAYAQDELIGRFSLRIPGEHNLKNALGSIAVARELGIAADKIRKGLADFAGVRRRFEIKGTRKGITVIDDYGHHPTEIRATLKAARAGGGRQRIVAVFQPHLYSRTRDFYRDFASAFLLADILVATDVYAARELPLPGITGGLIVEAAREMGHTGAHYVARKEKLAAFTKALLRKGDMVITLGAGDIWKYGEKLLKLL